MVFNLSLTLSSLYLLLSKSQVENEGDGLMVKLLKNSKCFNNNFVWII